MFQNVYSLPLIRPTVISILSSVVHSLTARTKPLNYHKKQEVSVKQPFTMEAFKPIRKDRSPGQIWVGVKQQTKIQVALHA